MSPAQLVLRYSLFAALATLANLGVQRLVLGMMPGTTGFIFAIGAGTAAGLLLKYLLDKRWIFMDVTGGLATHSRKFTLYTLMGVVTTLIFWGSETAFWLIWQTQIMREAGAVLGLVVGYVIKYRLDKAFVFRPSA